MKKLISILLVAVMVLSVAAYVNTYEVTRNLQDMQRMITFSGVYVNRTEIKRLIDNSLHELREPQGVGNYRYAKWEKTNSVDSRMSRMDVEFNGNKFQNVKEKFENIHQFEVSVPSKWGFFHGNDPIYVKRIEVRYKGISGKTYNERFEIERWFNKKESQKFILKEIAVEFEIGIQAAAQVGKKKDCALYVNGISAELRDLISNPYYREVESLKNLVNNLNTISNEEALTIVNEVINKFDSSIGGGSGYVDTELVNLLTDIRRDAQFNPSIALRKLDNVIRNLNGENYDYNVIRELEEVRYYLQRNQYGDKDQAVRILDRVIDKLENITGNSPQEIVIKLKDVNNDLPYNTNSALNKIRRLISDLTMSNTDNNLVNEIQRIERFIYDGGFTNIREAQSRLQSLISRLEGYSYNNGLNKSDVIRRLEVVERNLPDRANVALRDARSLRDDILNSNFDSRVLARLDSIIELIQKGTFADLRIARDHTRRLIENVNAL